MKRIALLALLVLPWIGFWNAGLGPGACTVTLLLSWVAFLTSGASVAWRGSAARCFLAGLIGLSALALLQLTPWPSAWWGHLAGAAQQIDAQLGRSEGAWPVTYDPAGTREVLLFLVQAVLLVSAALKLQASATHRRWVAISLVASVSMMTIVELSAQAGLGRLFHADAAERSRPFGPFLNRNHAATLLLLATPIAIGLIHELRQGVMWSRIAVALAAVLCGVGLAVNGCRGAAVAGLVAATLWVFARARQGRSSAVWGPRLAVVAVALAVAGTAWMRVDEWDTVEQRAALMADGWRMVQDSPWVGHGLGAFHAAYPPYQTVAASLRFRHVESEPFDLWVEGGGLGLLAGLLLLIGIAGPVWTALRDRSPGLHGWVALGLLAVLVHACMDFSLRIPGVVVPGLLALASLPGFRGVGTT